MSIDLRIDVGMLIRMSESTASPAVSYVEPMPRDPRGEIRQPTPGPVESSARRMWRFCRDNLEAVSAAGALVAFLVGLLLHGIGAPTPVWVAAYLVCYVAGGWEPGWAGLVELKNRRLDVDLLMIVAAIAAASIGQWRDGALLIVIFATSGALETFATRRTEAGVRALMKLAPEEASLLDDGVERRVSASELGVGDLIVVRPGERVGADGDVAAGTSDVDESSITGESIPVPKRPGEEVFAGTINGAGAMHVRVTRPGADSVIARIAAMVDEAKESKGRAQLFIEGIEQRYSIGMVITTLAFLALPVPLLGWTFEETLLRAMTFMIVASPCAVVLATMPPLLSAIANAARNGVLVKGGIPMEGLGQIDAVAFDKTGTLTEGSPVVTDVVGLTDADETALLSVAAGVEQGSEHPLGRAVAAEAHRRGLPIPPVTDFQALPGRGVQAKHGHEMVRIGSHRLLTLTGRPLDVVRQFETKGKTALAVEVDGQIVGVIALADRVRADAAHAVATLRQAGIERTALLTGDQAAAAQLVANATGVDDVRSGLLPADKVTQVRQLQQEGQAVLLVGDGVNDAPALATAQIGVAMGGRGTDVALETADVVLVTDRLQRLPQIIELSRRANRVVKQNLAFAATVIVLLVGLDLAGHLPLPLGVAGHEGSTILVALNGLRLLRGSFSKATGTSLKEVDSLAESKA